MFGGTRVPDSSGRRGSLREVVRGGNAKETDGQKQAGTCRTMRRSFSDETCADREVQRADVPGIDRRPSGAMAESPVSPNERSMG